jgi:hypothetical protein
MTLAETQRALFSLITGHGSAADAERARELVVSAGRLSADERVEIYAQMFSVRTLDALREDFPKLTALLGDHGFAELCAAYVHSAPSEHPSLAKLGARLTAFLREHTAEGARADLADLAALEWARAEVFVEADAEPLVPSALGARDPKTFAATRLKLIPALRVLVCEHDVAPVWRALQDGHEAPTPQPQATSIVVWRKEFEVFHATVAADEGRALVLARAGRTLEELCDEFAERDDPAAAAFQAIGSWFTEGMVAGLS